MHQLHTSQPRPPSRSVASPSLSSWSPLSYIYTVPSPLSPFTAYSSFNSMLLKLSFSLKKKKMTTKVEESFSVFYDKWICQLEQHLQQLLNLKLEAQPADPQALVFTLTTHYKEYYAVKWAAANDDVLAFFCPVWTSPLENAYSWVTDWKPSMMFQLIDSLRKSRMHGASLADMSEDQVKKIEELRVKIRLEEEKVEREMERQQVAMADRKMVELARLATRRRNGEVVYQVEGLVEVALKRVLSGLERVMKAADCVRLKTLKCVLEVLRPWQCVDFLTATCMLQLQLRQCGKKRSSSSTQNDQNIGLPQLC